MNKKTTKLNKLTLNKETLVRLNESDLSDVAGGKYTPPPVYKFPTKGYWVCDLSLCDECRL